jgi:hypothetical protein
MKGFRLSKTSWLVLATGVFVVVLIGLGVTRSQQIKEQSALEEELSASESRLAKVQVTDLRQQLETLQEQIDDEKVQLAEAKERLKQTVISADVTEQFFAIAEFSGVVIMNMSTSTISDDTINSVSLSTISLSATVTGDLYDIVNFVINLNNSYTTGIVQSVQINIPDMVEEAEEIEATSTGNIQMIVYSYEGT